MDRFITDGGEPITYIGHCISTKQNEERAGPTGAEMSVNESESVLGKDRVVDKRINHVI